MTVTGTVEVPPWQRSSAVETMDRAPGTVTEVGAESAARVTGGSG